MSIVDEKMALRRKARQRADAGRRSAPLPTFLEAAHRTTAAMRRFAELLEQPPQERS